MPTTSDVKNLGRQSGIIQKEEGLDTTMYPHPFSMLSATSSINADNTASLTQCFTTHSKLKRPSQLTSLFSYPAFSYFHPVFFSLVSLSYYWYCINNTTPRWDFCVFCHFADLLTALQWQSEPGLLYCVTWDLGLGWPVHWGEWGQPSGGVTERRFQPMQRPKERWAGVPSSAELDSSITGSVAFHTTV